MPKTRRPAVGSGAVPLIAVPLSLAFGSWAGMAADVATVTVDGASQHVLFVAPVSPPVAAVVMFPGGDGRIDLLPTGAILRPGNFLIRTEDNWLARGMLFVGVDAAEGRAGTHGDRVGPANQRAIADWSGRERSAPRRRIWPVGTSAGAPPRWPVRASRRPGTIRGVADQLPRSAARPTTGNFRVRCGAEPRRKCRCRPRSTATTEPGRVRLHLADAVPGSRPRRTPPRPRQRCWNTRGDLPRSGNRGAGVRSGMVVLGIEDQVVNGAADWTTSLDSIRGGLFLASQFADHDPQRIAPFRVVAWSETLENPARANRLRQGVADRGWTKPARSPPPWWKAPVGERNNERRAGPQHAGDIPENLDPALQILH